MKDSRIQKAIDHLKKNPGQHYFPAKLLEILNLEGFDATLASSLRRRSRGHDCLNPEIEELRRITVDLKHGGTAVAYYWGAFQPSLF